MPTATDSLDTPVDDSDEWLWGIKAIAAEANLYKRNEQTGEIEPDVRRMAHLLATGAVAGKRVIGRNEKGEKRSRGQWVSTRGHVRNSLLPETK